MLKCLYFCALIYTRIYMKKLSLLIVQLLLAIVVFANGDPVAMYSALTLSRTPVGVHVPEVQLVNENITFRPCGLYTEVNVRYSLVNNSDKDFKNIPYGFPIDYEGAGAAWIGWLDPITESEKEYGWRDSYVRDVNFVLNGQKLKWQCSNDTVLKPSRREIDEYELSVYYSYEEYEKYLDDTTTWAALYAKHGDTIFYYTEPLMRRWYYTNLSIAPHAKVELQVTYRVEHNLEMPLNSTCSMIDKMYKESNYCRFEYDFSPASYWGNGHVDNFDMKFDASKVEVLYLDDENNMGEYSMKRIGDVYSYVATNFNLAEAEPLVVDFSMKPDQMHRPLDRIAEKTIPSSEYTITVSGIDGKYPVSNMLDGNLSTTSVLRPGKNDTMFITIHFKDSVELGGVLLYNGYCKSPEVWRNNSRIKKCLLCVYWEEYEGLYELNSIEENLVEPPKAFDRQTLTDEALLGVWRGPKYVSEFSIVITDITPGTKYNDLCISELILLRK